MNHHILLLDVACVVVMLNAIAASATPFKISQDIIDYPVTSTHIVQDQLRRVPRQLVDDEEISKAKKKIKKQRRQLARLKCKPRPTIVNVTEYIRRDIDLLDKDLYPKTVVIKLCIESCSYCVGEKQVCMPHSMKKKTVIFRTISDNISRMYKMQVPEHKTCKCK